MSHSCLLKCSIAILYFQTAFSTQAQNVKSNDELNLRIMTFPTTIITTASCEDVQFVENDGQIKVSIPISNLQGDSLSLSRINRISGKASLTLLIDLPDVDDTVPVFTYLESLGPMQLCSRLKLDSIDLFQEVTISNVKYKTSKLVSFDLDLFADTRNNLSPVLRRWQIMEIELCATQLQLYDNQ